MKKLKLYLETSVWSYYYTINLPDKMEDTRLFFETVKSGKYDIYISNSVYREIYKAKDMIVSRLIELIKDHKPTELEITSEVYKMADKYIKTGALPRKSHYDAMHAAIASVYNLDALISWNYKHLANLERKNRINGINIQNGYKLIDIITPVEVKHYEE